MSSFKKLNKADVTTVSYHANKKWNIAGSDTDFYTVYTGQNVSFNINGTITNGQYNSLVYRFANHTFYQSYTDLLDTGSLMFNVNTYESASSQRPTSSYFDYNDSPFLIKNFPTGAGDYIKVVNIDKRIYGNKILPNSFLISSSNAYISDDGYGNLYDITGVVNQYINLGYITVNYFSSGSVPAGVNHVGNIFYAHGIIVITNSDFISKFPSPLSSTTKILFQNEHIIYENEVRCIVRESDFNLSYNPTLVSGSYFTTGVVRDFATGSTFQPYVTTIGLYNDENDLLMVAKLAKPIMLSSDTDMTFIVRYDT